MIELKDVHKYPELEEKLHRETKEWIATFPRNQQKRLLAMYANVMRKIEEDREKEKE